jgi:lipopolysaccharide export system permease protein
MIVRLRPTLYGYLARLYAVNIILFLVGIISVMMLFDALELLRWISKKETADFSMIGYLTLLKMPGNIMTVAPFTVLFAAIFALAMLTRRQEMAVMRASGASLWQLLLPMFAVAFVYGVVLVGVINPLSAATEERYQRHEEKLQRKDQHLISLLNQGMWLQQQQKSGDYLLLHARTVKLPKWDLGDVTVLFFHANHEFIQRLDAPTASFGDRVWIFPNAVRTVAGERPQSVTDEHIPTTLTKQDIEDSFAAPDTVSFWKMPGFIKMLQATGFPVTRLQIHFGALAMLPLLCAALVLIAAAVTIRPARQGGQMRMAAIGIVIGFIVFFLTNFLQALGASEQIPVILAACAPALLTFAGGTIALLVMEDQ